MRRIYNLEARQVLGNKSGERVGGRRLTGSGFGDPFTRIVNTENPITYLDSSSAVAYFSFLFKTLRRLINSDIRNMNGSSIFATIPNRPETQFTGLFDSVRLDGNIVCVFG